MQDFTWNKCWVIDHDKKEVFKASVCTWLEMSRADDISNIIWCHWRPNKKLHEWTRIYFVSRSNTLAVKCFNSGMRSLIMYTYMFSVLHDIWCFQVIVTEKMIVYITFIYITLYSRRCECCEVWKKEAEKSSRIMNFLKDELIHKILEN